jgi:hypothetical protein
VVRYDGDPIAETARMTEPTPPTEQPPSTVAPATDTAWRPPDRGDAGTWRPPRQRESGTAALVVGGILIAVGIWYFLEQTLGIRMPRIVWRDIWPLILIVIGVIVIVRSLDNRRG